MTMVTPKEGTVSFRVIFILWGISILITTTLGLLSPQSICSLYGSSFFFNLICLQSVGDFFGEQNFIFIGMRFVLGFIILAIGGKILSR